MRPFLAYGEQRGMGRSGPLELSTRCRLFVCASADEGIVAVVVAIIAVVIGWERDSQIYRAKTRVALLLIVTAPARKCFAFFVTRDVYSALDAFAFFCDG